MWAYELPDCRRDCQPGVERRPALWAHNLIDKEFKSLISQVQGKAGLMTRSEFFNTFKYIVKHDTEEFEI